MDACNWFVLFSSQSEGSYLLSFVVLINLQSNKEIALFNWLDWLPFAMFVPLFAIKSVHVVWPVPGKRNAGIWIDCLLFRNEWEDAFSCLVQ